VGGDGPVSPLPTGTHLPRRVVAAAPAGVYDLDDVASHLTCLGAFVVLACRSDAARRCTPTRVAGALSGANLMLAAERACTAALAHLGPSRFVAELDAPAAGAIARGVFIEQYHTTRRFVEIITPLMAVRLQPRLREAVFRYYAEEVGHEVFELEACAAMGLDADAVRAATPLPYWVAYLEVFGELARTNPIAFLLSVLVTEGLPGAPNEVNSVLATRGLIGAALEDAVRRHEQVNVDLDHTSLPRRLMSLIDAVDADGANAALDELVFLVELNFRAWDMLADYYGDPANGALPVPFAVDPARLLGDETA
jgi:hypothetical protein